MSFGEIYWPVFAALISAFVATELFHMALGFYLHRKQDKLRKEFEEKVARGEIDPMQMMFGGLGPASGMGFNPLPTVEGTENVSVEEKSGHGQYL